MAVLPPEYLDANTPPDVDVTDRVRDRYPDPTLGVRLPMRPRAPPRTRW